MIKVLSGQCQFPWSYLLAQTACRRETKNALGAQRLERKNVGAVVHFVGQELVPFTMPGQKQYLVILVLTLGDRA